MQDIYRDLHDADKLRFRKEWGLKRTFQFTEERRSVINTHTKGNKNDGVFLPVVGIAARLGGADNPQAVKLALNYAKHAAAAGPIFMQYNSWLEEDCYLYIEKLVYEATSTTWEQEAKSYSITDFWKTKAQEGRATRNYACVQGIRLDRVELQDIIDSKLGLEGWASMTTVATAKHGETIDMGPKKNEDGAKAGTRKASAGQDDNAAEPDNGPEQSKRAKQAKQPNVVAKTEKDAKEIIAERSELMAEFAKIEAAVKSDEQRWSWAKSLMDGLHTGIADMKVQEERLDGFVDEFARSLISPKLQRELNKNNG